MFAKGAVRLSYVVSRGEGVLFNRRTRESETKVNSYKERQKFENCEYIFECRGHVNLFENVLQLYILPSHSVFGREHCPVISVAWLRGELNIYARAYRRNLGGVRLLQMSKITRINTVKLSARTQLQFY